MVLVKLCKTLGLLRVSFLYGGKMEKEIKENVSKKSIWKRDHIPLKDRKTSSGITFLPKKAKGDKNAN